MDNPVVTVSEALDRIDQHLPIESCDEFFFQAGVYFASLTDENAGLTRFEILEIFDKWVVENRPQL